VKSESQLQIRKAVTADTLVISSLSESLGYSPVSKEESVERLQRLLQSEIDQVWVCVKAEKIVGWMHIFLAHRLASAPFVEIGGIVVDTGNRQQGAGKMLVKQAKDWATENDCKLRVRSNSVREEAQQFYLSTGFTQLKNQNVFELG
jgi:N-acetylglutamate synthase-like GNAT family acetyltransferase